jgi:hypothetical protein
MMPRHSLLRVAIALLAMALAGGPDRPLARAASPAPPGPAMHGGSVGLGIAVGIPCYLD